MLSFTPLSDATEAVSLKAALWPRKLVPGWNEAYDESERARNRASRRLRSFPVERTVLVYQRVMAVARRDINKNTCFERP